MMLHIFNLNTQEAEAGVDLCEFKVNLFLRMSFRTAIVKTSSHLPPKKCERREGREVGCMSMLLCMCVHGGQGRGIRSLGARVQMVGRYPTQVPARTNFGVSNWQAISPSPSQWCWRLTQGHVSVRQMLSFFCIAEWATANLLSWNKISI